MTEYITREEAVSLIFLAATTGRTAEALKLLRETKTSDVVKVVRCKDCEYSRKDGIFLWCDRWKHGTNPEGEGWCYLGEKSVKNTARTAA